MKSRNLESFILMHMTWEEHAYIGPMAGCWKLPKGVSHG